MPIGEPCSFCEDTAKGMRVISKEEHQTFAGVTFDQEGREQGAGREQGPRVYVRTIQVGPGMGWGQRLLWTVTALALGGLFFFVALPMFLLLLGAVAVIWTLLRLLR